MQPDKRKFKLGDLVIGNKKADSYGITTQGWIGKVEKYEEDNSFTASGFTNLNEEAFDLFTQSSEKSPAQQSKYNPKSLILLAEIYVQNEETNEKIIKLFKEILEEEQKKQEEKSDEDKKKEEQSAKETVDIMKAILKQSLGDGSKDGAEQEVKEELEQQATKSSPRKTKASPKKDGEDKGEPAETVPSSPPDEGNDGELVDREGAEKVWCGVCRKYHTKGTHD